MYTRVSPKSSTALSLLRSDNMPPCELCGGRHSLTSGCDVTVNLKRVCDESSIVLKGIGELMGGIVKIQGELAKGKTCVEVEEKIVKC